MCSNICVVWNSLLVVHLERKGKEAFRSKIDKPNELSKRETPNKIITHSLMELSPS
jgi:hypothetical protein